MPISLTLQIPTIVRYNKNIITSNTFENLIIKGINFSNNSVLYFYTGSNFTSGTQVVPIFISNTELHLSSINIPANTYNFLVYNTDSKLYSNNFTITVKNYNNLAPTLSSLSSIGYEDQNTSIPSNQYYYISPTGLSTQVTDGFGTIGTSPGSLGTNNVYYRNKVIRVIGTNFTPDTIILVRDVNNAERYFINSFTFVEHLVDDKGQLGNNESLASAFTGIAPGLPYGNHSIVAVNKFGISNAIPFQYKRTVSNILDNSKSNIDDETNYDYILNSCDTSLTTLQGIDGGQYPVEQYTKFLFNTQIGLRKRVYSFNHANVPQFNTGVNLNALDNANNCNSFNCLESDYIPLGRNSFNLTTAENTILDNIKGCEITVTSTPGPNNSATWNAWQLFSAAGGSINISDDVGELTKQFEILSNKKINFLNLDITADIAQSVNSSLTILIERFDTGSNTFVTVTTGNTGTWTTGNNQKKTIAISAFTASTRFRISITSAVDQFLSPIHTIKKLKIYDVACPGNYYLPLGRNSTNLLTSNNTFFAQECEIIYFNTVNNFGTFDVLGANGISKIILGNPSHPGQPDNDDIYFDITFPDNVNINDIEFLCDVNNTSIINAYAGIWTNSNTTPPTFVRGYRSNTVSVGTDQVITLGSVGNLPNNVIGTKWRITIRPWDFQFGLCDLTLKKIKLIGS
jgi:hypothetical protein